MAIAASARAETIETDAVVVGAEPIADGVRRARFVAEPVAAEEARTAP